MIHDKPFDLFVIITITCEISHGININFVLKSFIEHTTYSLTTFYSKLSKSKVIVIICIEFFSNKKAKDKL